MDRYYLIYKIVNKINGMIYIGCHNTTNPNDRYMGSGTNIKKAIKQYKLENFEKIILYQFDNKIDMLNKEAELVNKEFIADDNNYNIIIGGHSMLTIDTVTIRDKDGNTHQVHITDPKYLSGEYVPILTGKVPVRDSRGNTFLAYTNDSRFLSGELVAISKDRVTVKDKFGNYLTINKNDPRYLSGELVPMWVDRKHTSETKQKMREKASLRVGDLNSQFGTCWITNGVENKKIKKGDSINEGWYKGRCIKQKS